MATGDVEAIRALIARSPADLEKRMERANRRRRPLHLAVVKNQPAALIALLDLGANPESLDEAGFTALDQAALSGAHDLARILLDRGAVLRLPAAVGLERTREIEKRLRKDPDILRPGHRWGNLIVRASELSPGSIVEALIHAGASVNAPDDPNTAVDSTSGYTPLHAAAFRGNQSAAAVLLKHGADVRVRDSKYHGTPAGWADYAGRIEVRDLILASDRIDLIEAVQYGLVARAKAILDEEPESLDRPFGQYPLFPFGAEKWYTPLVYAQQLGHKEMVRFLLERGANPAVAAPLAD